MRKNKSVTIMNDELAFTLVREFCLKCDTYFSCPVAKHIAQRQYWIELIRKANRLEYPDGNLPKLFPPNLSLPFLREEKAIDYNVISPTSNKVFDLHFAVLHKLNHFLT